MATRQEILNALYDSEFIHYYCVDMGDTALDKAYMDDIIQDIWVMVCSTKPGVLERLWDEGGLNQVRKYCSGLISRQLHSKSSTIFRKYKRYAMMNVPIGEVKDGGTTEDE